MPQSPPNLGHFELLEELAPNETYLALTPSHQKVILKKLEDDCLSDNLLHPSIKERLERIQQIPHIAIANLHGVELINNQAYLVWSYVEGTPLETYLTTPGPRGRLPDLTDVGRDLVMAVEGLARLGLVHGSLHGGNIIVTPAGIRLTHLSPYLYTDPQEDARAVVDLLLDSLNQRYQPGDLPVHRLFTRASEEGYDLASLGPLLACPPDSPLSPTQTSPRAPSQRGRRRKPLLAALLILLLGLSTSLAILYHLDYLLTPTSPEISAQLHHGWARLAEFLKPLRPSGV